MSRKMHDLTDRVAEAQESGDWSKLAAILGLPLATVIESVNSREGGSGDPSAAPATPPSPGRARAWRIAKRLRDAAGRGKR